MEWIALALALLATLAGVAAAAWWRMRARARVLQRRHVPEEGAVLAQARIAAASHARGRAAANPHPLGTSAHALWETQFQRTLGDFTQEMR